ncbi:bifunctional adenosylcobinamide kinase/adenosylcobinamide-phosphate guanylyltransferase [Desulfohalobiaceae bacterium Ax17]|uniref:bifunctional adenosylcobinamide kinase/adenosylcobinamide-phosphate guanylyltransferase n=1 Tax=Desulfovulcanus ferrireducens TaxID=2831190 RepID=UPI00207B9E60|nr:bifunctional adenosylcobinamide kinase/adenosylcobinamide-phosphate guanylyltransferase [Desulfovulcanus ferrireducens]MBT8762755.1 bifunctional adenosylcobinamide kinase/adenosylcobinamide-phosphate guanylyltransferase [Desulfovulcanus ferrireducens]
MFSLVLGGNKSGKSDFGLELLLKGKSPHLLIVTGKGFDFEFKKQIKDHRLKRDPRLFVHEIGTDLSVCLKAREKDWATILVDSLDFWLFSLFEQGKLEEGIKDFFSLLKNWQGQEIIFVSSEIGLGPIPVSGEMRRFVRALGDVNQNLARLCAQVYLVLAGIPVRIK